MVTLRTYWTAAEAALAKSLLDNYEIQSALLHENSSLYSEGGQIATPIRLIVADQEAHRANLLLHGDFEKAADLELAEEMGEDEVSEPQPTAVPDRNPWELLIIAFYLLVPAVCLIVTKFPQNVGGRWATYYIAYATITHFLAWVGFLFAACLMALYFLLRRSARTESPK
jgi:hypothetical protein